MHLLFNKIQFHREVFKIKSNFVSKVSFYLCNFNALDVFNEKNFAECKVCDCVFREFVFEKFKFSQKVCLVKQLESLF